jgi:pyruvate kinase
MPKFNRTKIVSTLGPATDHHTILTEIIKAGVDVCRINMSHGDHAQHQKTIDLVHTISTQLNLHIPILLDLQGPKIRIGEVANDKIFLKKGKVITITTKRSISTENKIFVNYSHLAQEVKMGDRILLDDGKIELKTLSIKADDTFTAKVMNDGFLTAKKGVNLPNSSISVQSMTKKDHEDLIFGLKNNVEWIALSFVRKAEDIRHLRGLINKHKSLAKIIAKIEKPEGVKNFDAILKESDAIMVARGDLGVEIEMENVPIIQKQLVRKCIIASKPVIIATQMMESMINSPTPTRAEATDVANAVMDGADAVMLSAETSVGKYPLKVIEMMTKIITVVETQSQVYYKGIRPVPESPSFYSDELCFTAVRVSDHLNAKAIIGMTYIGYTAFKVAAFRPKASIFIFTSNKLLMSTLSLVWGVRCFFYDKKVSTDETFHDVSEILKKAKLIQPKDVVIHLASMPITGTSRTNTMKITVVE